MKSFFILLFLLNLNIFLKAGDNIDYSKTIYDAYQILSNQVEIVCCSSKSEHKSSDVESTIKKANSILMFYSKSEINDIKPYCQNMLSYMKRNNHVENFNYDLFINAYNTLKDQQYFNNIIPSFGFINNEFIKLIDAKINDYSQRKYRNDVLNARNDQLKKRDDQLKKRDDQLKKRNFLYIGLLCGLFGFLYCYLKKII